MKQGVEKLSYKNGLKEVAYYQSLGPHKIGLSPSIGDNFQECGHI